MVNNKKILKSFIAFALFAAMFLGGCSSNKNDSQGNGEAVQQQGQNSENESEISDTKINVAFLKGPTGIGGVMLMDSSDKGEAKNKYDIQIVSAPGELTGKLISGEIDIAAVPTNVAATLYNKTEGNIKMAAINTLGTLYVVENGDTIHSVKDLSGKTIYISGQGATPEYAMKYILEKNGVDDVEIVYSAEHAELASQLASGSVDIAVLPEPNVTAVTLKNPNTRIALDLTEEWENVTDNGSQFVMGAIVARKEFIEINKDAFDRFLDEYKLSIEFAIDRTDEAAELVEKYGIMASAEAAKKAIPNCNLTFISGDEMKSVSEGFFEVLYNADAKSVGGSMPDEDFYYTK